MQTVRKIAPVALVVLGVAMIVAATGLARNSVVPNERVTAGQARPSTPAPSTPALTTGSTPPHGAITFDEPVGGGQRPGSELAFLGPDEGVRRMTNATARRLVADDAAWSADGERRGFCARASKLVPVHGRRGPLRHERRRFRSASPDEWDRRYLTDLVGRCSSGVRP